MCEKWLPVVGYEGKYEVSDQGRVRSLLTNKANGGLVLKQRAYSGYLYAGLWFDGHLKQCRVHRLVLAAFVGPCPEGMECLHGPGGAQDNRLSNIRWGTREENMRDQVLAGTHHVARRTHCPQGHAYDEENTYIRPDGRGRGCNTCMKARSDARKRKGRAHLRLSECMYGHPLSGDNLYVSPSGTRRCRACNKRNSRNHHSKVRG